MAGGRCIVDAPAAAGDHRKCVPLQKMPEGLKASPSGGPEGSHQLPRDKISLSFPHHPRLAPTDFRHGLVIARAVAASFHRGRPITASVGSGNARGCCAAGRMPNGNGGSGARSRTARNTPRPNANAVVANGRRRRQPWAELRRHRPFRRTKHRRSRGHAAKELPTTFAIVRAATLR